jgi:integrase
MRLLKYVHGFVDRHGHARHYFRRNGRRNPLPGLPGSSEFMAAYQAALDSATPTQIGAKRTKPGSVNAALVAYYGSLEFRSQAVGTQSLRRAILERFRERHGEKSIAGLHAQFLVVMLGKMQPSPARNWLNALRALCQFCVTHGMIAYDPTRDIKLPRVNSDGHHTFTEAEIAQFEARHAVGTKARLAFALLLYTGQRASDVSVMGPQHISNGAIPLRQKKTKTSLCIPIHPALQTVLDATPSEHLTFLVGKSGKPYSPSAFSHQFRAWCDEAGLPPRCVAHGLRKAACRRLAEAGCSASEIAAISGHKTLKEIERYTKAADQERLARSAMARIRTDSAHESGKPGRTEVATPLKSLMEKA